jgi:hypothetical protein
MHGASARSVLMAIATYIKGLATASRQGATAEAMMSDCLHSEQIDDSGVPSSATVIAKVDPVRAAYPPSRSVMRFQSASTVRSAALPIAAQGAGRSAH